MSSLPDLEDRLTRLEATVADLSGLKDDMRAVLQAIGTAPSPATGQAGSGLLRAVADLIAREAERDRASAQTEARSAELVAYRGWATALFAMAAAAASIWGALR